MAERRRLLSRGTRSLCALGLVAGVVTAASATASTSAAPLTVVGTAPGGDLIVRLRVPGGGIVTTTLRGVHDATQLANAKVDLRRYTPAHAAALSPPAPTASRTSRDPAVTASRSTPPALGRVHYPQSAALTPGTIVSIAGGYCDGRSASQVQISPESMAVASDGAVWWIDDDAAWTGGTVAGNSGRHADGSMLLRRLGGDGVVRTVTSLLLPTDGRAWRQTTDNYGYTAPTTLQSDGHGGVLVQIDAGYVGSSVAESPAVSSIIDISANGRRRLVLGGLPTSTTDIDLLQDQPIDKTPLSIVNSFVMDSAGDIYYADQYTSTRAGSAGANAGDVSGVGITAAPVIRFANRSSHAVTFYPGTAEQLTVDPGHVGTIAAVQGLVSNGAQESAPSVPAQTLALSLSGVAKLVVKGSLLYLSETNNAGGPGFPAGATTNPTAPDVGTQTSLVVRAVNLGFTRADVTANGVDIANGDVARLAGNLTLPAGYSGDGVTTVPSTPLDGIAPLRALLATTPAQLAQFDVTLGYPQADFVVGADGSIDIADAFNSRVRRVDGRGVINTIAGDGGVGFDGDGSATAHHVWFPVSLTSGRDGDLLIGDYGNERIRALTPTGQLRTVVGHGALPCGRGEPAVGRGRFDGADLGQIRDVAADSRGDVYIADGGYNVVERVGTDGRLDDTIGIPTPCGANDAEQLPTCAGLGAQSDGGLHDAGFADPMHLLVDSYDNLYVSDVDEVRYVNVADRTVSVLGRLVPKLSVGSVFSVPNRMLHVRIVTGAGVITQDVPLPLGQLALDGQGQLYVADPVFGVVYRIDQCGVVTVVAGDGAIATGAGQGDGGPARAASITPVGIAFDRTSNLLFVADDCGGCGSGHTGKALVRAVNLGTRTITAFGQQVVPGDIQTIAGMGQLICHGGSCDFGDGGPAYAAAFGAWIGELSIDQSTGWLYVTDPLPGRVRVVLPDGTIGSVAGRAFAAEGVGVLPGGFFPFQSAGDGGSALTARLGLEPLPETEGGSVSAAPDGDLLVADASAGRVRMVVDPQHAPLQLGDVPPGLRGAGRGFSSTVLLHDAAAVALPASTGTVGRADGTTTPQLLAAADDRVWFAAARGDGAGCDLWSVRDDADAGGHDRADYIGQPPVGAVGLGPGGADCALGRGPAVAAAPAAAGPDLAVATPVDVPAASAPTDGAEAGVAVAVSHDGGAHWITAIAGTTAQASGTGPAAVAITGTATGTEIAYPATNGTTSVDSSTTGVVYTDDASLPGAATVGSLVTSPSGVRYLSVLYPAASGAFDARGWVGVARSDDGLHWSTTRLAAVAADPTAGAPALAVDAAGTAYAVWGTAGRIYLAHTTSRGSWSAPALVATAPVAALPSIVAGATGRVAIAYYADYDAGASTIDPDADWYVDVARSVDASARTPRFTAAIATTTPVASGVLCGAVSCPPGAGTAGTSSGRAVGPPALALTSNGVLHVGYTSSVGTVGYLRACSGPALLPAVHLPRCAPSKPIAYVRPPANAQPVNPAPATPLLCSVSPPPFPVTQRRPVLQPAPHKAATATRHGAVGHGTDARPGAIPPLVVEPPVEPAIPPGQAPAQATQLSQAGQQATANQPGVQPQAGAQTGLAAAEEAEVSQARNYAYARRSGPLPPPAFCWGVVAALAGIGAAARRRRRPAYVVLPDRRGGHGR